MLKLFNSLSRKIEEFKPIHDSKVAFYACGPTVYDYAHIGNLRTMILNDILHRAFLVNGYQVNFIINITDVGHLTSDGDTGEDKLDKVSQNILYTRCSHCNRIIPTGFSIDKESFASSLLRHNNIQCPFCHNSSTWNKEGAFHISEQEKVLSIAEKYEKAFYDDLAALNIIPADKYPKASHHIQEHIDIIQKLVDKGFAYESDEAVYFEVSKFPKYNQLVGQNLDDMMLGARQEVVKDPAKKNPIDFVLWFKAVGRYQNHILKWPSPWGEGFPGWHIECSSMSAKYLGQPFDVHTGGVDLKFPHHTNEIAQSVAAYDKPLANYWIHGEHLLLDKGKMSKSEGNFLTLPSLIDKGFNPLSFRYLVLTTHYRSKLNFSLESLTGAQNALNNLYQEISTYDPAGKVIPEYDEKFTENINNDLETPQALAIVWDLLKSENESADKLATLFKFDEILGLKLQEIWNAAKTIPDTVRVLIDEREVARKEKDFTRSDELRRAIESNGYIVEDTPDGLKVKKKF